jgi:hypothetical protein
VLRAIDQSDVFVCDITYFNHNVLFELGYAVGKNKKILILLNKNINNASARYSCFFLKAIRYTQFENAADIQTALQNKLFEDNLVQQYIRVESLQRDSLDLLYIKSKLNNQPAVDLSEKIFYLKKQHGFSLEVDDPIEISYRPETWYFQNILRAKCVVIHFWGENAKDAEDENARNSFFAGIAAGLEKKVLLVAPAKFKAPLDYYEILSQYESSAQLTELVDRWLTERLIAQKIETSIQIIEEHKNSLIKLGIGSEVAEYEQDDLLKYFVETASYRAALRKQRVIVVGRKGSGKTAIYIKIIDDISRRDFQYIVDLKPESDELIENAHLSVFFKDAINKNYFFLTVWRLTIFSKLAYAIYNKLITSPEFTEYTTEEACLIDFVKRHERLMQLNVYGIILEISKAAKTNADNVNSAKFLGDLYSEYLKDLLAVVKNYFRSIKATYNKIVVIADNLDRAWNEREKLDVQSEMLISLLEIENKLKRDLLNKDGITIDLQIIIFLRKDIFEYLLKKVSEPDKMILIQEEIDWETYPELLKKVIENRFMTILNLSSQKDIENTWKEFFDLPGKDPFNAIKEIVTRRPRDVIYFVSQLFDSAINRNVEKVTSVDFENAISNYTNFLNENLIAETKAEYPEVAEILTKLQEYHGDRLEYQIFSRILDSVGYDPKKKDEFTATLFSRGYMLGFDTATGQPFDDISVLRKKLQEKRWFFWPNKVFVIAHAKYYMIKNMPKRPF